MARLEDVSVDELEGALDDIPESREAKRLMAAVIYKRGPSAPMIAEWFDTREQTVYRWFDRLESEPVEQAITDRQRSGRPPKLEEDDLAAFREAVQEPPTEVGYDRPAWTTGLARRFLEDEFAVEYSRRHVQRLLRDAGLTPSASRPHPPSSDEDERTEFWEPATASK